MDQSNNSYDDYFQQDYSVDREQFQQLRFVDSSHSLLQKIQNSQSDSKKELTTGLFRRTAYFDQGKNDYPTQSYQSKIIDAKNEDRGLIQFSSEVLRKNSKIQRGDPKETTQLNANLKTETCKQLLRGIKLHRYSELQKQALWRFISGGCSFEDTLELFQGSEKIRTTCLKLYESPAILANIMNSQVMHFSNKIILIKYLNTIAHNARNPNNYRKWKQVQISQQVLSSPPVGGISEQLNL